MFVYIISAFITYFLVKAVWRYCERNDLFTDKKWGE